MKQSNDLYGLIGSLSMSEKRHFKIFASKHVIGKENNYVTLFDAITNSDDKYDEEKLKKKLKNKIPVKFLSESKNYLLELVLKSLESYHANSIDEKIRSLLHQAEILFAKSQYNLCLKIIRKVKETALKFERHSYLIEILRLEFEVNRATSYAGKTEKEILQLFHESAAQLEKQQNSIAYRMLAAQLFMYLSRHGFSHEKEQEKFITSIMNDQLFKDEGMAKTYISKYSYYHCHTAYYFIRNDFRNAYNYVKKLSELIENNFHQVEEKPRQYITTMNNLIVCEMSLKKYKQLPHTIARLRALKYRTEEARQEVFYLSGITELELHINTGQFEKGADVALSTINEIEKSNFKIKNLQYERTLFFTMAIIFFGAKNYRAALKYLNEILTQSSGSVREDMYYYSKILSLIVYFEMGKQDLLEYAVRSTYRFLSKHKQLHRFEAIVLDFIRKKAPLLTTDLQRKQAFSELKEELVELKKDPLENNTLKFFDLISWLESKITGRSLAEIVKEKSTLEESLD